MPISAYGEFAWRQNETEVIDRNQDTMSGEGSAAIQGGGEWPERGD